jgi:hypothetical protein
MMCEIMKKRKFIPNRINMKLRMKCNLVCDEDAHTKPLSLFLNSDFIFNFFRDSHFIFLTEPKQPSIKKRLRELVNSGDPHQIYSNFVKIGEGASGSVFSAIENVSEERKRKKMGGGDMKRDNVSVLESYNSTSPLSLTSSFL